MGRLFPRAAGINRGIGGDTTEDILDRLDSAIVEPAAVSLLIGTNDLHGASRLRNIHGIAERTRKAVTSIQQKAPGVPVFLNSVTPRTALLADTIRDLNELYRQMAEETGCSVECVGVDPGRVAADGVVSVAGVAGVVPVGQAAAGRGRARVLLSALRADDLPGEVVAI